MERLCRRAILSSYFEICFNHTTQVIMARPRRIYCRLSRPVLLDTSSAVFETVGTRGKLVFKRKYRENIIKRTEIVDDECRTTWNYFTGGRVFDLKPNHL